MSLVGGLAVPFFILFLRESFFGSLGALPMSIGALYPRFPLVFRSCQIVNAADRGPWSKWGTIKQTNKQPNKQASPKAIKQTTKQTNKQGSKNNHQGNEQAKEETNKQKTKQQNKTNITNKNIVGVIQEDQEI